jgi:beta-galactosidase
MIHTSNLNKIGVLLSLLSFLFFSVQARAQSQVQTPVKDWEFIKQDLGSVWEAVRPAEAGRPESVPLWTEVTLPHSYNAQDAVDPDVNYYQGPAWYRTAVSIDNPYENGRVLLHSDGSGQKTKVFVYNEQVGDEHVGGYDEWTVDITDAVSKFKNSSVDKERFEGGVPISIRTDNSRDVQMIPSDMADHTIYGGLYRGVDLVYVPELSLENVHIRTETDAEGKTGTFNISTSFRNPAEVNKAEISYTVTDPSGEVVETISEDTATWDGMQQVTNFSIDDPVLWSPENPELYQVTAEATTPSGTHALQENVGFRHFRFEKNGPFYLNGERLLLKGTHHHEDHAGVGAAETEEMIRQEFKLMKEMGVNFIRLGHYQQREFTLDMCDSLGFLVWEEIPWNRGGLGGPEYKEQGRRMLTNMITQHYNHPSIIMWGLGNEQDWPGDFPDYDKQKIRAYMKELHNLSHKLDDSRVTTIRRCDFAKDIVDVYSPSIWAGWYGGRYTQYREATKEAVEGVDHFFHAEWGGDSHAGRHEENPYTNLGGIPVDGVVAETEGDAALEGGRPRASSYGDWSESYIIDVFDWTLKEQETMPYLTGAAQWIFKDFATPLRPNNPIPYVNQKGVIGRNKNPKESYYVFQSYWTDELMAHIYGHTWPVRWGREGQKQLIKVFSNGEEAELFVNGESQGMKTRDSQDFPAAGLRWEVPLNRGQYKVRVEAHKGDVTVTDNISFRYQTDQWEDPAQMKLEKIVETEDTTTVQVTLLDENGVLCLDAQNVVEFGLTGDGNLIDNLGTTTGSRKLEVYNGRAIISIKENGGPNVVSVRSDGIPTQLINLNQ